MDSAGHFSRASRLLGYRAKQKVLQAAPGFLQRVQTVHDPYSLSKAAVDALRPWFPAASPQELDVVAFYLVAKVAIGHAKVASRTVFGVDTYDLAGSLKSNLDSMSELCEMESLRLQMAMDRRSKFMSTLSNLMKKIASTEDTLVQNLK